MIFGFRKDPKAAPSRPKRGVKNKKRKTVKFSPDTKLHSVTSVDQLSKVAQKKVNFEPDGFINAIQNILGENKVQKFFRIFLNF